MNWKKTLNFGLALCAVSLLLPTSSAQASLLGQTISTGWDSVADEVMGIPSADPADAHESFQSPIVSLADIEATLEPPSTGRQVDFTEDSVTLLYSNGSGIGDDLFVAWDLSWGGLGGEVIGLELDGANPLGALTAFTSNSIGILVPAESAVGDVTFKILVREVPEPSALALAVLGMAIVSLRRSRS